MVTVHLRDDVVEFFVPLDFVLKHTRPTWTELLWAVRKRLINHQALIEMAVSQLSEQSAPSQDLIDLCWLDHQRSFDVEELAAKLGREESTLKAGDLERDWLKLALAWVAHEWERLSNPPGYLENVIALFGYPNELGELNSAVAGVAGAIREGVEKAESDDAFLQLLNAYLLSLRIAPPTSH